MAERAIRVAAVGDLHCTTHAQGTLAPLFAQAAEAADVLLLAGDLTDTGLPEEARALVRELTPRRMPTVAVFGNHDLESSREEEIHAILSEAGVDVLDGKAIEVLAKLSGGVAIIRVGAATETEMKEKKHRVEDALSAARAAVEEGIVPGGEISLINASDNLDKVKGGSEEEQVGISIVKKALEAPIRKLSANAGQDGSVIIDGVRRKAKELKNKNIGYNVLTGELTDMIKDGVIDPVKVVRGALENAASIASMILTTEVLITDLPEKDKPAPAMPPGGMDY